MTQSQIIIKEIIDTPYAVSAEKADKLKSLLERAIREKRKTQVSFKDLEVVITAFLNVAIGELYKDFSKEDIDQYLDFVEMNDNLKELIPMIKERSCNFYTKNK